MSHIFKPQISLSIQLFSPRATLLVKLNVFDVTAMVVEHSFFMETGVIVFCSFHNGIILLDYINVCCSPFQLVYFSVI